MMSAKISFSYLLLFPYHGQEPGVPPKAPTHPRDAPYFFDLDIEFRTFPTEKTTLENTLVSIHPQVLDDQIWVIQTDFSIEGELNAKLAERKTKVNATIRNHLLSKYQYHGQLVEEYGITLATRLNTSPEAFLQRNQSTLARLLRSSEKPIAANQAHSILKSRVFYSDKDVTVVDWEGALIIADQGDFQPDIDLLVIGNYQLLKYRVLDEEVETDLDSLRQVLKKRGFRWLRAGRETLYAIVQNRLQLLLDFEWTDQALLLIGEWYPAQLYRVIVDEFYIDDWRKTVSGKLNSLSEADEAIRTNLAFSWSRLLDFVQIGGWLILLIDYFFLFLKESKVI